MQPFIKDSEIRYFEVVDGKVLTTMVIGEFNVTNPSIEDFLSTGWKEYTPPEVESEPYIPTLEELVEQKIRERYSINKEFEIQRKRDIDTEAFQVYFNYVEECIAWAKEQEYQGKYDSTSD